MTDFTRLVNLAEAGDSGALRELFDRVYQDLKRMASRQMAGEPSGRTLQPTALVHEVYLRLFGLGPRNKDRDAVNWASRGHFFAAAAEAMRRILVEAARSRRRLKRGGDRRRVLLDPEDIGAPDLADEVLALNEALNGLANVDSRAAQLVSLRFFGGLTIREAAASLGVSPRTADASWAYARAWLLAEIQRMHDSDG